MKKIIIASTALLALVSCQESIINTKEYGDLYKQGVVLFQANDSKEIAFTLEESSPVSFTITSSKKVDADTKVNFEPVVDQDVLDAFNKASGTNYELMPEDNFEFEDSFATIKAGSAISDPVTVNIDVEGFKNGAIYCLPVRLLGADGMKLIPGKEYAYIVIRGYVYASAASLPGGSYFSMPATVNSPALALEECTLEIRVKVNRWASSNPFISSVIGVEENFLMRFGDVSCDPNQLQLAGQGVSITSKAHFDTGKWYHVAIVASGIKQTCKMYINGELDSEQPMGSKGINLGQVYNSIFAIGMSEKGRYLNGYVSEARVWGRELSPTELINGQCSIANPKKEAADNKLLGYWKLDAENKGKDLTGNGYDGVASGSVSYTAADIRCPE